jgi:hypothetical protein
VRSERGNRTLGSERGKCKRVTKVAEGNRGGSEKWKRKADGTSEKEVERRWNVGCGSLKKKWSGK